MMSILSLSNEISFRDAMKLLWSGEKVDLVVVKYDHSRKQGGQFREYKNVRLNISLEKKTPPKITDAQDILISNNLKLFYRPTQYINIILPNGGLRKIYKVGILKINDKSVLI